jgi:hypothetical protein
MLHRPSDEDGDPPQARIKIPAGIASARIKPPGGEPGFFELLMDWLQAQARIKPPIG